MLTPDEDMYEEAVQGAHGLGLCGPRAGSPRDVGGADVPVRRPVVHRGASVVGGGGEIDGGGAWKTACPDGSLGKL